MSFDPWQLLVTWLGTMTLRPGLPAKQMLLLSLLEAKYAEKDAERETERDTQRQAARRLGRTRRANSRLCQVRDLCDS